MNIFVSLKQLLHLIMTVRSSFIEVIPEIIYGTSRNSIDNKRKFRNSVTNDCMGVDGDIIAYVVTELTIFPTGKFKMGS